MAEEKDYKIVDQPDGMKKIELSPEAEERMKKKMEKSGKEIVAKREEFDRYQDKMFAKYGHRRF